MKLVSELPMIPEIVTPADSSDPKPTGTLHSADVALTHELEAHCLGCNRMLGDGLNDAKLRPTMVSTLDPDAGPLLTAWNVAAAESYVSPGM